MMTISLTLPNGKELLFTKGEGGVEKLFVTEIGEVVVVTSNLVTKFGNVPFVCEYPTKEEKKA